MDYHPGYKELVDYLVAPYFEATASGEIVLANSALKALAGDVHGKRVWKMFDAGDEEKIRSICSVVQSSGTQQVLELSLERHGAEGGVLLELAPIRFSGLPESVCIRGKVKSLEDDEFFETKLTLKRQAEELAFLNHLSEMTSSSLDLDDILYSICRES